MDVQRIGKLQRQRSELEGPYPDPHSGPALEPQAIRVDGDLDVVIEDVVIEQIVLVVEASPRGELLLRRVQRDVVVPAAIEEADVLGLVAGFGIGECVVAARSHFGDEIPGLRQQRPGVAAQVAEIDLKRLLRFVPENLLGAPQVARIDRSGGQLRRGDHRRHVARVQPQVRRGEFGFERFGAAEDPDLSLLRVGRGVEIERAAAEQDESCHPLIGAGDEHRPVHQRQVDVFGRDFQVVRDEFFRGVEAEAVQVLDRGQRLLLGDRPLARRSCCADAFDVEAPRGGTRARAVLGERVGD